MNYEIIIISLQQRRRGERRAEGAMASLCRGSERRQNKRIRSSAAVKYDVARATRDLCISHTHTHRKYKIKQHSVASLLAKEEEALRMTFFSIDNSLFVAHSITISTLCCRHQPPTTKRVPLP